MGRPLEAGHQEGFEKFLSAAHGVLPCFVFYLYTERLGTCPRSVKQKETLSGDRVSLLSVIRLLRGPAAGAVGTARDKRRVLGLIVSLRTRGGFIETTGCRLHCRGGF